MKQLIKKYPDWAALFVLIIVSVTFGTAFNGCVDSSGESSTITPSPKKEKAEVKKMELLEYPVKIQYVEREGMEYMITSATYGEAGVHVRNLTLDKEQLEYYQNQNREYGRNKNY